MPAAKVIAQSRERPVRIDMLCICSVTSIQIPEKRFKRELCVAE